MLEVIKLTKKYADLTAIDNISFNAVQGKILGLIGPNGAGKTTTIRSILNIIKPTSGDILFDGKPIDSNFYNKVGYLPEERGLYKKSKVSDVLKYFAVLKVVNLRKIQLRLTSLLEQMGIEELVSKNIEQLSKGNQQKVQFISSILHDPQILILDEPFAGLDPINQQIIKEIIAAFLDDGKIIIISTHMMEVAENLCSDIFLLNKGKEVLSGSLKEIKQKFGGNTYKLKYEGDCSFINEISGVRSILKIDNNTCDITFNENIVASELLTKIISKLKVSHFAHIEPNLNNIFIESVKTSNNQ